MNATVNRRQFLVRSAGIGICGTLWNGMALRSGVAARGFKKGICMGVLPQGMPVLERFEVAKRAGFEGVEPNTIDASEELQRYKKASGQTGIRITSIMNADHWKYPLSDSDPETVEKCMAGIRTSMRNAHELGADAVLLVPGIVTSEVRYVDVYRRSQEQIRKLLPLAEELRVVIAVENVGNRFLLSPIEFANYIDGFSSRWVKAYFDIGNVVSIGYPQDWIRTLGNRIVRVHIKRFEPGVDHPKFDPQDRRTQGINWPEVRKALLEVGYSGWITAEVKGGDESYVKEVSARLDRILAGQDPI